MDEIQQLINKTIKQLKEKYEVVGEDRNRIVFLKDDLWVIKCPLNEEGISDNISENRRFRDFGKDKDIIRYAECHMSFINDINILEMERVHPINPSEVPEWASWVDCGQVGKTASGEIVAYDYA